MSFSFPEHPLSPDPAGQKRWFQAIDLMGSAMALLVILPFFALVTFLKQRESQLPEIPTNIHSLPYKIADWQGVDLEGLGTRSTAILQLDEYIRRRYTNSAGEQVSVYIGYWRKQSGDFQAAKHSPALCLPSNGWLTSDITQELVDLGNSKLGDNGTLRAKRLIGKLEYHTSTFYYWFFTGKKDYANEWTALLNIALQKIFENRSDGGIVEISSPHRPHDSDNKDAVSARQTTERFIRDFYPALNKLVREQAVNN